MLSMPQRVLIGVCAGLVAVASQFLAQDAANARYLIQNEQYGALTNLGLETLLIFGLLAVIGAICCAFSDEGSRQKLLVLGVSAPALVAGWTANTPNYAELEPTENRTEQTSTDSDQAILNGRHAPKMAAVFYMHGIDCSLNDCIGLERRDISFFGTVKERLGIESSEPKFWVIVGSKRDKSEAAALAEKINATSPDLSAFVGKRKPGNDFYPVIVGDFLDLRSARELQLRASRLTFIDPPYLSAYADRR